LVRAIKVVSPANDEPILTVTAAAIRRSMCRAQTATRNGHALDGAAGAAQRIGAAEQMIRAPCEGQLPDGLTGLRG
jgi:hypothetical protein